MNFLLRALRFLGHQHWIPRGRDRVIRLLAAPDMIKPTPFRVPFFGHFYEGTLSNFIDWSVYFYGAYSRHELDLLADLCALTPPGRRPCMLDVGANGGNHTLFMANRCERIDAFEPFPPAIAILENRLATNGIKNCRVHPVGLADQTGAALFIPPLGSNPGTGYFDLKSNPVDVGRSDTLELRIVEGGTYLDANHVPPTDILKIDVEGAEANVLAGLSQRLHRDRPAILMELSDRSRRAIGDLAGFQKALYPDSVILSVLPASISGTYRLACFDFQQSTEVLILPVESLRHHHLTLVRQATALLTGS